MASFPGELRIPIVVEADDFAAARRYSNAVSFQICVEKLPPMINHVKESDDISGKRMITVTGETSISFTGRRKKV